MMSACAIIIHSATNRGRDQFYMRIEPCLVAADVRRRTPQKARRVRLLTSAATNTRARFDVANQADDFEIRRLLRENPMPGKISISLEREPDYFIESKANNRKTAEAVQKDMDASNTSLKRGVNERSDICFQTIVAREGTRVVC